MTSEKLEKHLINVRVIFKTSFTYQTIQNLTLLHTSHTITKKSFRCSKPYCVIVFLLQVGGSSDSLSLFSGL